MQLTEADDRIRHLVCSWADWRTLKRLGVAVSGGGDSMTLLHMLAHCAGEHGVVVEAATVDHGQRPEAADEAAFVADICTGLSVRHEVLRWDGWDGQGNLQAAARAARYRLLAGWARRRKLPWVALGHTLDDQAETFLMRLARRAGVDGLAAMDNEFTRDGARFCRPMLALARTELRDFLTRHRHEWRDDPSNEDLGFDRVKARKVLAALAPLGIDADTLGNVAANLHAARGALRRLARDTAERIVHIEAGDVVFDRRGFHQAPPETMSRLLSAALVWVSGAEYPPRRDALTMLEIDLIEGKAHTLHGCLVITDRKSVRITREFNAVRDLAGPTDALWDNRWRLSGPHDEGLEIRALGAAVKNTPWRDGGLPRAALMASPAVWRGDTLVAAPVAGLADGWSAEIDHPWGDFHTSVLSH